MPQPTLTKAQRAEVVADIRNGMLRAEGTKKYGITPSTWGYYQKKALRNTRWQAKKRDEKIAKIQVLADRGLSGREIDEKLGLGKGMALYYLRQAPVNGAKPRIRPIVLDMANEEASRDSSLAHALDLLWARLGLEEKLRAIEAIDRREE